MLSKQLHNLGTVLFIRRYLLG